MSIVTDSKGLEESKDPSTDTIFKIFKLLGNENQTEELRKNYIKGGFGYGHAKNALLELILDNYKEQRINYNKLMTNTSALEKELAIGEAKASKIANEKLKQVRQVLGFN